MESMYNYICFSIYSFRKNRNIRPGPLNDLNNIFLNSVFRTVEHQTNVSHVRKTVPSHSSTGSLPLWARHQYQHTPSSWWTHHMAVYFSLSHLYNKEWVIEWSRARLKKYPLLCPKHARFFVLSYKYFLKTVEMPCLSCQSLWSCILMDLKRDICSSFQFLSLADHTKSIVEAAYN